ncbi:hypothetical protein [Leifsonia sp. EB34]|uniref:hypothetical protein n=1 Tax=Leifsonia sp. EB34 TaxID=3156303 RepID=UPI0035118108
MGERAPALSRPAGIVLNVAAVLGLLCVAVAAVAILTGMRVIIFSTGSMAPTTPAGSLAVTLPIAARDIAVGDVISAPRAGDGALVTHRVVSIDHEKGLWLVSLRGDANKASDATPYDVTEGAQRLVWSVPGVGAAISQVRSPWILVAVLALLALIAIPTRRRAHRHRATRGEAAAQRSAVSPAVPAAAAPEPGPAGR